jgi:hypothetical protein
MLPASKGFWLAGAFTLALLIVPVSYGSELRGQISSPSDLDTQIGSLSLEEVARFGGAEPDQLLGLPWAAHRIPSGWLVLDAMDPRLHLFDFDGGYLRSVGRRGEGPGEFMEIGEVLFDGDSLFVNDPGLLRISVFDSAFAYVRSTPISRRFTRWLPAPSGWIVHGLFQTRGSVGQPLHLMAPDGEVVSSFGREDASVVRGRSDEYTRILAPSDRGFWAAHFTRYRLELWDFDEHLSRTIDVDADWFRPHHDFGVQQDGEPSPPAIYDVREDADTGHLWVLMHVIDPDWEDGLTERRGPQGRTRITYTSRQAYFDTLVEVIDIESGMIVARRRFDELIDRFGEKGHVYGRMDGDQGEALLMVWALRLQ